ncbi:MAG: hypothetical protein GY859_30950 [Desulfobacterales bacterium]|nr:hypothetical protein [Desulfobacterales bacterium]
MEGLEMTSRPRTRPAETEKDPPCSLRFIRRPWIKVLKFPSNRFIFLRLKFHRFIEDSFNNRAWAVKWRLNGGGASTTQWKKGVES